MSEYRLLGWGRQPWSFVTGLTENLTCAWADYDGFHVDRCPPEAPPYSHLWAWSTSGDFLVRVRIDAQSAIVGALSEGECVVAKADVRLLDEQVKVHAETAILWPQDHGRIAQQPQGVLDQRLELVTALGPQPLTFVRKVR